jgi:hypothetical protein
MTKRSSRTSPSMERALRPNCQLSKRKTSGSCHRNSAGTPGPGIAIAKVALSLHPLPPTPFSTFSKWFGSGVHTVKNFPCILYVKRYLISLMTVGIEMSTQTWKTEGWSEILGFSLSALAHVATPVVSRFFLLLQRTYHTVYSVLYRRSKTA